MCSTSFQRDVCKNCGFLIEAWENTIWGRQATSSYENPGARVWDSLDELATHLSCLTGQRRIVLTSGGLDPTHGGHCRYLKAAKGLGDILVVVANSDSWLIRKKAYVFLPRDDRLAVLSSIRWVDHVLYYESDEDHVGGVIRVMRPHVFANGGDRTMDNLSLAEIRACREVDCEIVCGVGGNEKIQSSSWLTEGFATQCMTRP